MNSGKIIDSKVGLINGRDLKKMRTKVIYWCILALLWIGVFVCLVPPIWLFTSALKNVQEIHQIPPTIIPKSFEPWKIADAWKRYDFSRYYLNTMYIAVCTISINTITNGLVAYTLSRIKPAGHKIVMTMLLSTFVLPAAVTMVPTYMTWLDFPIFHINFLNTYWPFIIAAFCAGGMNVIIYKTFFDNIPDALLEAAKLDGCSEIGIFFKIVMPICKPIIVTTIILGFNTVWNDFLSPLLYLPEKSKWTVMLYTYKLSSIPMDELMLVLTFAILPPVIVFFFFQKHIMNGFTMSGVKE